MGRSALVAEAVRSAPEAVNVMSVVARPGGEAFRLGALLDLLAATRDEFDGLPRPQRRALRRASSGITAAEARTPMVLGLTGLVARRALTRPVLLVVEDVQWLDDESAALLAFLAHRPPRAPLAMLLTQCTDATRGRRRLTGLEKLPTCALRPLGEPDVAAAVHQWTGVSVPAGVGTRLTAATQGNPRVLQQLVEAMSRAALAGEDPLPHPLPAGAQVEAWFGERVRRLDLSRARALAIVAAGTSEPLEIVLDALHIDGTDETALERVEQQGLAHTDRETVHLAHPLLPGLVERLRGWLQLRHAHAALASAWARRGRDRSGSAARQRLHRVLAGLDPGRAADLDESQETDKTRLVIPEGGQGGADAERRPGGSLLTPQEIRIVQEIVDGASNAEVAQRLFLSVKTVEFHLRNVYAKLSVHSRTQLVRRALDDVALLA